MSTEFISFLAVGLEIVLLLWSAIIVVPTVMLMIQCVIGSRHGSEADPLVGPRPSVDVLVPAHNERSVIEATLRSIQPQLQPGDRLCVVADNCSDDTASIARSMGAEVVERFDDEHRAKGYAIACGLDHLQNNSREVVLMVDADCIVTEGAVDRLAKLAIQSGSPIQSNYQMPQAASGDSTIDGTTDSRWSAVSTFAVTVKNQVRPLGLHRLGFGCVLTGSGMAFPAALAREPNWASDNIVEDMKTSYDLMIAGHAPRYCADAVVYATLPANRDNAMQQRKRWEHGHLQTLVTQVPRLFTQSLLRFKPSLLIAAVDLMIPPLSLLVQIWLFSVLAIAVTTWAFGLSMVPVALVWLAGAALMIGISVAWYCRGREQLSIGQLFTIPFYILSKVPLYVAAIFDRQKAWKRTDRDTTEPSALT